MSSFQPLKEVQTVEVPVGTNLELSGAFKGWTLWHLDANQKESRKSSKPWRLTAGPAHVRKLNEVNAEKGLPRLKENFRKLFDEKGEALQFIVKYTTHTLETESGELKIPPYLKQQIMTVVTMIVGNSLPHAKDINLVTAVRRESERLSRVQKTVRQLVVLRGARLAGGFDVDHPLRHLQYPRNNSRLIARMYFQLLDLLGTKMLYDVTPDDAKTFVEYMRQKAREENHAKTTKQLGDATIHVRLAYVVGMFNYALKKHWCDENPFEEVYAQISKSAGEYNENRKKKRKPHDIKLLQALIRAAWNENKLMCFAYLLAILEGLRRCEILRAPGSCIRLTGKNQCIKVGEDVVKKRTEIRFVPFSPSFRAWLPVYINILKLDRICGFTEGKYAKISRSIRETVAFQGGGKDELRKDWTMGNQGDDISAEVRALIEGHSEDVMRVSYNGDASPEFTEELHSMLDPLSVLGYIPAALTVEELKACVPKPSKGGGRCHRKYKAKRQALLQDNDGNSSVAPGEPLPGE